MWVVDWKDHSLVMLWFGQCCGQNHSGRDFELPRFCAVVKIMSIGRDFEYERFRPEFILLERP